MTNIISQLCVEGCKRHTKNNIEIQSHTSIVQVNFG